jgi:hypothetical protein
MADEQSMTVREALGEVATVEPIDPTGSAGRRSLSCGRARPLDSSRVANTGP